MKYLKRMGFRYYAKTARPKGHGQMCLRSGYKFLYRGKRANWSRSSDELWEVVVRSEICGRWLGRRLVDGAAVDVVSRAGKVYAGTHGVRGPGRHEEASRRG